MIQQNSVKVKEIFNKISIKYDFLNNVLSFGLHNLWKQNLINLLKPKDGEIWADLCCGTGDLSFLINKKVFPNGYVLGVDNAYEILNVARNKSKGISKNVIYWEQQDIFKIEELNKYDGIFTIRYFTIKIRYFTFRYIQILTFVSFHYTRKIVDVFVTLVSQ